MKYVLEIGSVTVDTKGPAFEPEGDGQPGKN